jgi:hypothetical protein
MRPSYGSRKMCPGTGKRRYDSYFAAKAASREIRDTMYEDHGNPYRCDDCDGWHLGRSQPF